MPVRRMWDSPTPLTRSTLLRVAGKIHLPSGDAMEADLLDGHVMWHEDWTHGVENVGTSDIQAIIVEARQ